MNFFYHFLLFLLFLSNCIADDPLGNVCNNNTAVGAQLSTNIDHLLVELVSKAPQNGYVATSYGKGNNKVYGLAQCRGDVDKLDCTSCIQDAARQIQIRCSNINDARIWYDYCFLRYDTQNFIGQLDTFYNIFYVNVQDVTDPKTFNKKLGALTDTIKSEAVQPANKGLGKGESKLSSSLTLYALAQCTRDLPPLSCSQCIGIAVGGFQSYCANRKGCRALYSSCYVRYEQYPFFFPLDPQYTSASPSTYVVLVHP
ncbi:Gnk2-homologous domain [Dillenia turbinata]|uniref:Gnk2-homologous domain n=1 Tax=Dillenia turbinata TaxID=194707 RepID=A0AAN8VZA3_9MAGN